MPDSPQPKHTPTPWECGKATNYHGFYIAPKGTLPTLAAVERVEHNIQITTFNFPGETEANAEFIVRAVNSHEALLEACRFAHVRALQNNDPDADLIAKLFAAIQKAEAQP
jgi:hypothetical protein